jgi:hypothetical protein
MHLPIKPEISARTITGDEVMRWFARGHRPWPTEAACAKIGKQLTQMRWASDPQPVEVERYDADPWWNPQDAAARAKALLDDVPVMLWFWHGMQMAPKEFDPRQLDGLKLPEGIHKEDIIKQIVPGQRLREGYDVIDRLRVALEAALPYIQFPFGRGEPQNYRERKTPKPWHASAVAISRVIIPELRRLGHQVHKVVTHNTAVARIVRLALERMGYSDIKQATVAARLTAWYADPDQPGRLDVLFKRRRIF